MLSLGILTTGPWQSSGISFHFPPVASWQSLATRPKRVDHLPRFKHGPPAARRFHQPHDASHGSHRHKTAANPKYSRSESINTPLSRRAGISSELCQTCRCPVKRVRILGRGVGGEGISRVPQWRPTRNTPPKRLPKKDLGTRRAGISRKSGQVPSQDSMPFDRSIRRFNRSKPPQTVALFNTEGQAKPLSWRHNHPIPTRKVGYSAVEMLECQ